MESRVEAVLERRGLGSDALRVVDNLLRHGPPAPRAAPPLVLELLARPLAAADAARIFRAAVPASLTVFLEGLRSSCWRLQAAARAAFVRLGASLPGGVALPAFLRRLPPQEDTY